MKSAGFSTAADTVIYAVGDIHGRLDLWLRMLGAVRADLAGRQSSHAIVILLGDLVDRGPDSRAVIESVASMPVVGARHIALAGNHEAMMLGFLRRPREFMGWLSFGGDATLRSYAVDPTAYFGRDAPERLAAALDKQMPVEHRAFLEQMPLSIHLGDYFFAHAGIRPGIPLERQTHRDLQEIRAPFLDSRRNFGVRIVHGHTPAPDVELRPNRVNVDIGAVFTGRLAAVVLEGQNIDIIRVNASRIAEGGADPW